MGVVLAEVTEPRLVPSPVRGVRRMEWLLLAFGEVMPQMFTTGAKQRPSRIQNPLPLPIGARPNPYTLRSLFRDVHLHTDTGCIGTGDAESVLVNLEHRANATSDGL